MPPPNDTPNDGAQLRRLLACPDVMSVGGHRWRHSESFAPRQLLRP